MKNEDTKNRTMTEIKTTDFGPNIPILTLNANILNKPS